MTTLDLTCRCGARLQLATRFPGDAARERRAFDQAHEVCRKPAAHRPPPPPRPPVLPDPLPNPVQR